MGRRRGILCHVTAGLTRRSCGSNLAARLKLDDSVPHHIAFVQLLKQVRLGQPIKASKS